MKCPSISSRFHRYYDTDQRQYRNICQMDRVNNYCVLYMYSDHTELIVKERDACAKFLYIALLFDSITVVQSSQRSYQLARLLQRERQLLLSYQKSRKEKKSCRRVQFTQLLRTSAIGSHSQSLSSRVPTFGTFPPTKSWLFDPHY